MREEQIPEILKELAKHLYLVRSTWPKSRERRGYGLGNLKFEKYSTRGSNTYYV